MKLLVAVTLVVVSLVAAESPNRRIISQRQTDYPYEPRGWRPDGQAFNPTVNFQRQQQGPADPVPSYGPPPSVSYGPPEGDTTITEEPTTESVTEGTTLDFQGEDLKSGLLRRDQKAEQLQNEPQTQPGPVYVVLPQGQSLIYATALRPVKAAPLIQTNEPKKQVEIVKEPKLAPIQAVPALARIQAPQYEPVPQVVQLQPIQAQPYARYISTLSQTAVHTPYSDSFVQIYQ